MGTTKVSARWTGEDINYIGTDAKGNQIKMGGDDAPSPSQLVLLGLAGCMGMDVVSILQKMKQPIKDVQVEVIGHQPENYPRPFTMAEIAFTITGDNVDPKSVERAMQLSAEKYCVVGQTLQNHVEIKTSFVVVQG